MSQIVAAPSLLTIVGPGAWSGDKSLLQQSELYQDDTKFVTSPNYTVAGSTSQAVVKLASSSAPNVADSWILYARAKQSLSASDLWVSFTLYQGDPEAGGTPLFCFGMAKILQALSCNPAGAYGTFFLGTAFASASHTLTVGQRAAITDYTNLYVLITAFLDSGSPSGTISITEIYMDFGLTAVPATPGTPPYFVPFDEVVLGLSWPDENGSVPGIAALAASKECDQAADDTVYVESNIAAAGGNSFIQYRFPKVAAVDLKTPAAIGIRAKLSVDPVGGGYLGLQMLLSDGGPCDILELLGDWGVLCVSQSWPPLLATDGCDANDLTDNNIACDIALTSAWATYEIALSAAQLTMFTDLSNIRLTVGYSINGVVNNLPQMQVSQVYLRLGNCTYDCGTDPTAVATTKSGPADAAFQDFPGAFRSDTFQSGPLYAGETDPTTPTFSQELS